MALVIRKMQIKIKANQLKWHFNAIDKAKG